MISTHLKAHTKNTINDIYLKPNNYIIPLDHNKTSLTTLPKCQ